MQYLPTLSYIYPKNGPSVGKYSIHGGIWDILYTVHTHYVYQCLSNLRLYWIVKT